jgi:adenosylcobinamide-phosphate synthase
VSIRLRMTLVTLLIALLLDRARPLPDTSAPLAWFRRYADRLAHDLNAGKPVHGTVGWLAAVCPLVLLALVAFSILYYLNPVLGWLWSLAVLYLCLGFRSLTQVLKDIYAALHAGDLDRARELLARWRGESASEYRETEVAKAAVETALARAQREVFGIVFWFVVLPGPSGPVLYRLAAELESRWGQRREAAFGPFGRFARRAFLVLDWAPARLAAIGFAIAGNFEDAISSWRSQAPAWPEPELGIVLASGAGAMNVQLGGALPREGGVDLRPDLGEGDPADAEHLQSTIYLLWRSLVVWFAVLALITLARWVGG